MSERVVTIFIEPDAVVFGVWLDGMTRLERLPFDGARPDAAVLNAWLERNHLVPGPVVLGLSSTSCFAAELATEDLPRWRREAALRYRLEAKLPDDLETLDVVFVGPHRPKCLAVATRRDAWQPVVEQLRVAGFEPRYALPTALLCAADKSDEPRDVTVQNLPGGVDHLGFDDDGLLESWRFVPAHPDEVGPALDPPAGASAVVYGVERELLPEGSALANSPEATSPDAGLHVAVRHAVDLLDRDGPPPLNFLSGATNRERWLRAWTPAFVALGLVVWVLAGLLFFAGIRHQQQAVEDRTQLRDEYTALFPDQRAPAVLIPRLRSEAAALTTSSTLDSERDALEDVLGVVLRLPADGGFKLTEVSAEPTSIRIVGEASSLGTIDGVAQSLADHPAVVVAGGLLPPTTQVMPSGATRFELQANTRPRDVSAGGQR